MKLFTRSFLCAAALVVVFVPSAAATHGYDKNCSDFSSQAEAQHHMNAHPGDPDRLDGSDQDGRACESNPCPCYYGTGSGSQQPAPGPSPAPTPAPSPAPTPSPAPSPSLPPPVTSPAPAAADGDPTAKTRRYRARISRVIDGDTVSVRLKRSGKRRTVRLIGIDAPELRGKRECGAVKAKRLMRKWLTKKTRGRRKGRTVRLVTDPSQARYDRYGRMLAYVQLAKRNRDVGRRLLSKGWAKTYVYDGVRFRRHKKYAAAERAAKRRDRGGWGRCFSEN